MPKKLKAVLLGPNAGIKAELVREFDWEKNDDSIRTIGIDFIVKNMTASNGDAVKLQVWDTVGQERFRITSSSYLRGADSLLFCYDISDERGLEDLRHFLIEAQRHAKEGAQFILVGACLEKSPERMISLDEAKALAAEFTMDRFIETSAITGENLEPLFQAVVDYHTDKSGLQQNADVDSAEDKSVCRLC